MISLIKRLPFIRNYTSSHWEKWWEKRQIDWKEHYLKTWNHPHRFVITNILKSVNWMSLLEVGSGPGANLVNIVKQIEGRQLGGIDINPEAIEMAGKILQGGFFKVCPVHDLMMSDSSVDIILSDMTLIYYGPHRIHKALEEIKRVARNYVLLSEFHSNSFIDRWRLRLSSGLHSYNYKDLLQKHGFYDIILIKMPKEAWPEADIEKDKFRYILLAKVPKRK